MIKKIAENKYFFLIFINIISILYGVCFAFNLENEIFRNSYILVVLASLMLVVFVEKNNLLRPISYLIISFVIFLWARPILSTFQNILVISSGNGITYSNVSETILFLGITQNLIILIASLFSPIVNEKLSTIDKERKFVFKKDFEYLVLFISIIFLMIFLVDSLFKIQIVLNNNYLDISENILMEGYLFFRIGKWVILAWVIFGTKENRFEIATSLLLIASFGFLVRGARGYFISYFFLWLFFYAKNHKIRFVTLCAIALGLILLANFILFYRMGWTSTANLFNTVTNTLYSQGASIEPVFGTMHFTNEIAEMFPKSEILFRYDFGNFIDAARGVVFESGGFGDSFFAELYFIGFPFGIVFLIAISLAVCILEKAYFRAKEGIHKNNYNLLLFMTIPNLIYFARSDIKDFIFKTLISVIFIFVLTNIKTKKTRYITIGLNSKIELFESNIKKLIKKKEIVKNENNG